MLWDAREFLAILESSEWFPVLVMVLAALTLMWVTGRLRRARERDASPWAVPSQPKRRGRAQAVSRASGPVVRKGKAGATCKWYRDKIKRDGTLERWQCRTCGVDAYTSDGDAPKECKRDLRETQL